MKYLIKICGITSEKDLKAAQKLGANFVGFVLVENSKRFIDLEKLEKADNSVYYDKIKTLEPKKVDGQYCYIKVVIKQKGDTIVKEEILECADGRKKFDGPSYWELFAQFYYRDINTPEYCRYYTRQNHAFKSFGKVCMNKDGEWEVQ